VTSHTSIQTSCISAGKLLPDVHGNLRRSTAGQLTEAIRDLLFRKAEALNKTLLTRLHDAAD